ncbi:MAG: carboxypeptidase regulatory-like domain-containing protein [Candidatus Acidiferrales bacterium]
MLNKRILWCVFFALIVCLSLLAVTGARAQSSGNAGSIEGNVLDPDGKAIVGASVELHNPVSGYDVKATTNDQGQFRFSNVPFNPYHLTVTFKGFQNFVQDVDVRSGAPITLKLGLKLAGTSVTVNVEAGAPDLLENVSGDHTDVDRNLFGKVPLESSSSGLSALVTQTAPGIVADSNGLFHGFGDHASNSFSIDGQKITDQQSKIFSNQVPVDALQSIEVLQGAPSVEYGDKTSVVIVATTRSGLDANQPTGSIHTSYGTFGTATGGFDLAYGGPKWGNFITVSGLNTGRFLDPPEFTVTHDKGNSENVFDRIDYRLGKNDSIQLNLGYTRSWFQNPNSFDAQTADAWTGLVVNNAGLGPNGLPVGPQDQRSQIATYNVAPTYTHIFNANTLFTIGAFYRQDQFNYYPSANPFSDLTPDLQRQSVGQSRRLADAGAHTDFSYTKGIQTFKFGIVYDQTFLREGDAIGIVDPTFNPVCLNADGSAVTDPTIVSVGQCGVSGTTVNPNFVPLLGCLDLTRPHPNAAQDGCTSSTASSYLFQGRSDIKELAIFGQDTITTGNWSIVLGVRGDFYNGITIDRQAEPRAGISYNVKKTNTVLRISYARTMETPFNENLIVSSLGCQDPVINPLMAITTGIACDTVPLRPGFRNEFHAGFQQAFGKFFVVDGEYVWKYTHNAYDFSILGNTPITFPIEWHNSKIPGFAIRGSFPNYKGFSAYVTLSSVAARFFLPQVSGIGATPGGGVAAFVPFRIDHDERFEQNTHVQYQFKKNGPWIGFNWRYDSGLVAGATPCFADTVTCAFSSTTIGGQQFINMVNTITGAPLSPDQEFEAGLTCNGVAATPTHGLPSTCLASQFGSTLINIPAPGTENDDKNPQRIAPRHLFDAAVGDDNIFHADRYRWSARFTVINLTNKEALYNFLSTFSGTHYVTPRTFTGELGFHF